MIIDIHTHTSPKSDDSYLRPAQLIKRAKEVGLHGLCLTEHDWFWEPEAVDNLCQEHDFLVLPGVETNTEDGHFLVFGLGKYVFGMHRVSFLREQVEEVGGAMILAHPHRRQFRVETAFDDAGYNLALERACENPAFLVADAVEVLNGRSSVQENGFSRRVSRRLKKKGTAGSDAHSLGDVGRCATYFEREITCLEDLITELKAGRFRPVLLNPPPREG